MFVKNYLFSLLVLSSMHFFSFTLKMEADVASLRYLGNLLQNVLHIVLFLFLWDADPLYLVSWSCIWSFGQKIKYR